MLARALRIVTAVCLSALASAASAAGIAVVEEAGRPVVHLAGEIELGDAGRFERAVAGRSALTVVLSGPGGKLIDALSIGEMIRARGDRTVVRLGANCTSACALIWIAGVERTLEDGGAVGFHAASAREGNTVRMTASGNAIVGAYLTRLGFPLTVVVMATEADHTSMAYLTAERAASSGLAYRRTSAPRRGRTAPAPSSASVAVAYAAPAAGSDLAVAARAPADAAEFVEFYFASVNAGPNALRTLAGRTYADTIVYFDETLSRTELIRRREDQRRRWPNLRMTRTSAANVVCSVAGDLCTITGDARYSGRDEPGATQRSGAVTYELTVQRADGWFRVIAERALTRGAAPAALATALQQQLARVGCTPGPVDGKWGRMSRTALLRFAVNSGLALGPSPSEAALAAVGAARSDGCGRDPRGARTPPAQGRAS